MLPKIGSALSSGDVNVRLLSGYFWMDNSCTAGSPLGKVVSFRIKNTKGSLIQDFSMELTGLTFIASPGVSYTSGTPLFQCKTPTKVFLGNIPAGDSVTAFFYVGYNCLLYPSNSTITTDYITSVMKMADNATGTVTSSYNSKIYVVRNSNNNTINILTASTNAVGTVTTVSVAMSISNVKPNNIIDMQLSTTQAFPQGYSIIGCKITSSSISDFPVNLLNTYYSGNIAANLPSGGTVTIEWYLKITGAGTGISSTNIIPYVVSDAGSSQRWQANTTSFTGTAVPTNPLTITKKANRTNVSTGDTLVYTVTLKNSSATADVSIDRIVDKLPRDYQFRYMEKNTGVFPRLVTYSNSTTFPVFLDTGYLIFGGQKEISSGVYSYVIPKQDSIKLIYSVRVSSSAGLNDTNSVNAYVGTSKISASNATASVNVLSALSIQVSNFKALSNGRSALVSWSAVDLMPQDRIELYKMDPNNHDFVLLNSWDILEEKNFEAFHYNDVLQNTEENVKYKLRLVSEKHIIKEFYTSMHHELIAAMDCRLDKNTGVFIQLSEAIDDEITVEITDMQGRKLLSSWLMTKNGSACLPFDTSMMPQQIVLVSVRYHDVLISKRILIQ